MSGDDLFRSVTVSVPEHMGTDEVRRAIADAFPVKAAPASGSRAVVTRASKLPARDDGTPVARLLIEVHADVTPKALLTAIGESFDSLYPPAAVGDRITNASQEPPRRAVVIDRFGAAWQRGYRAWRSAKLATGPASLAGRSFAELLAVNPAGLRLVWLPS